MANIWKNVSKWTTFIRLCKKDCAKYINSVTTVVHGGYSLKLLLKSTVGTPGLQLHAVA